MANESSWYYLGFEESVGDESSLQGMPGGSMFGDMGGKSGDRRCETDMYRNIYIYSKKDHSECMVLPFYFILGHHDYLWNADGDRLLISACYGFYEIVVDLLPDRYSKWKPMLAVVNVAERHIEKVYEGNARLTWNEAETDLATNDNLAEFSYEDWKAAYDAKKEELEVLVSKVEADYRHILGGRNYTRSSLMVDILDESVENKASEEFPEYDELLPEDMNDEERKEEAYNRFGVSRKAIVIIVTAVAIVVYIILKFL